MKTKQISTKRYMQIINNEKIHCQRCDKLVPIEECYCEKCVRRIFWFGSERFLEQAYKDTITDLNKKIERLKEEIKGLRLK